MICPNIWYKLIEYGHLSNEEVPDYHPLSVAVSCLLELYLPHNLIAHSLVLQPVKGK